MDCPIARENKSADKLMIHKIGNVDRAGGSVSRLPSTTTSPTKKEAAASRSRIADCLRSKIGLQWTRNSQAENTHRPAAGRMVHPSNIHAALPVSHPKRRVAVKTRPRQSTSKQRIRPPKKLAWRWSMQQCRLECRREVHSIEGSVP